MKSIAHKIETHRTAEARAEVILDSAVLGRVLENDVPKKDILTVARVAGILAVKKTHELIPYCHPVSIDGARVEYHFEKKDETRSVIVISVFAESIGRTGVEMEALTAASITALTIYDMLKPIDAEIEIAGIRLADKRGGKSDFKERVPQGFKAAVIVTSDGTAKGTRQDTSGRAILSRLESYGIPAEYRILPDEKDEIAALLRQFADQGYSLIVTTGGTGLSPRDVTVEATREVIDREVPGLMEAARGFGQKRTPYAMLSRGLAGQRGKTLIVNLPGSSKGVEESLDGIFPGLLHAYGMMRGGGHEATKSGVLKAAGQKS